jgi:putative transposase
MTKRGPLKYFRTSPEIIRLAAMPYIRFPLSRRNVEDLLHERSIDVSHEAIRYCWRRIGPMFASEIRKRRVEGTRSSRWRWHLDEIFVTINGDRHYLWRAVNHEGEILESFVTKTRDKKAAIKFLRKTMKKHGGADIFMTDRPRFSDVAMRASVYRTGRRRVAGSTIGLRTRTLRSDDESGRCSDSGGGEVFRN